MKPIIQLFSSDSGSVKSDFINGDLRMFGFPLKDFLGLLVSLLTTNLKIHFCTICQQLTFFSGSGYHFCDHIQNIQHKHVHTYQRFILKYPKLIREYVFALLLIRNKCPVFSLTHNTHPPLRTTENNISSKWSKYLMDVYLCGFYHITDYIRLYTFYA